MNYHSCIFHGLELSVGCFGDVRELKKFFGCIKYGRDCVSRMVCCLHENVLVLEDFLGHQLTVVFLEMREHVCHSFLCVDSFAIVYNRKIRLLGRGSDLLHEELLDSRQFAKNTHFLCVRGFYVLTCMGSCAVWDDQRAQVSWVNKGSV